MAELSEAARQARNEYKRNWYRKNKERVKASNNKYWERKAALQDKEEKSDAV